MVSLKPLNFQISTNNLTPFNFPPAKDGSLTALHSEINTDNLMFGNWHTHGY